MPSLTWTLVSAAGVFLAAVVAFLAYVHVRYTRVVGRVFEEKPLFLPLRVSPNSEGEDVRFPTRDGLSLVGTYFKQTAGRRLGVVVFCHEFLGDRWSALPYVGHLRALGFDLFTFDFRNHGKSDARSDYSPLQWVTDHELYDLRGALTFLKGRPDADPAGMALFGVSRGGGTALCVGGKDPAVWAVATDGAFPTRGTMLSYIRRWAEIYVSSKSIWARMPNVVFEFLGWSARKRSQARLNCRFPNVERATARLAPRPLLMIHGEKDAYIGPPIARALFDLAGEPKEFCLVPKAKHNRCREVEGPAYHDRLSAFFLRTAPRVGPAPGASSSVSPGPPSTEAVPGPVPVFAAGGDARSR